MHWRATSFDETKARCVIRKRCCWIPEHPVVHHGPTHVPVLLQGSVVWGVHVPGREWLLLGLVRRREAPLPSLWTRPLFSSPCSTCLSPLSLTAGQAFLQYSRTVFTAQSYQSHSEWVLHAAYVYASVQTRELVPQHVDKKKLDWTGEDHFLLSWALLNTLSLKT